MVKKTFIVIAICLILLTGGFSGGLKYGEYRIRKNADKSITELQSKLDEAGETICKLQSDYGNTLAIAGEQRKQLDSIRGIITDAKQFTSKHENESTDINATVADIENTVERISNDFCEIERIVESSGKQSN